MAGLVVGGSEPGREARPRPRKKTTKRKKRKKGVKGKKTDRWAFNDIFLNKLFYSFGLWILLCANNFLIVNTSSVN
jgi:hypothetical protein